MSRIEEERRLESIQDNLDTSIKQLEDYIKTRGGKLIIAIKNNPDKHKYQQNKKNRKTKMRRKTTAWTFQTINTRNSHVKTWTCLKKKKPLERN